MQKALFTVQKWIPYEEIYDNGIIKMKDNSFVKIIKISPINFNLKSNLEKEAILNSYKLFLKTCNFDIQILIQSKKEDLSKHISKIKKINNEKKEKIKNYSENYIKYIEEKNKKSKSSSKNYYIIIKEKNEKIKLNKKNINLKIYFDKLNEKYFKIKECLSRCGNFTQDINNKNEAEQTIKSFLKIREEFIEKI